MGKELMNRLTNLWYNYPLRFDPENGVVDKRELKHEETEMMLRSELEEVKKELIEVKKERDELEKLLEETINEQ